MPHRILIADDNANVRTALRQLMEFAGGVEFIEAENGEEAIAKALECRPDVIILDLAMPAMDGLTAARKILQQLPEAAVFLCTMHWSKLLEREAATTGVRKVFSKARSSDLIAAVQQVLSVKPAAAPLPNPAPTIAEKSTNPEDFPESKVS
ncbi:MAG TPA: response regulator transcription factor [Candidatus Sulfotelmatobacter sp.]|nr:response regulator transcription factor [Candidatus Sulfotelmatobacter sp.]